ncbi:MAG: glycosyltransferase family 4 protein [Gemmatales bacterium]|nr:glycosyltransferase family 4 protein [Gemmatales bacterium]MDW8221860.1 glycosyltransferase family 4 protein [Gemmatales bacterium]
MVKSSEIPCILLLSENFPPIPGGTSRWFYNLYSRLEDWRTIVVTKHAGSQPPQGAEVYCIDWPLTSWTFMSPSNWKKYWLMSRQVLDIARNKGVSVVHAGRCQPEGIIALGLKYRTGIPYLIYVHGEDVEIAWRCREYRYMVQQVLNSARMLVVNSRFTAGILRHKWKIPSRKLRILHPGVDTDFFVPATWPMSKNRFNVLCPGRLQQRKGQDVLLRAAVLARMHIPSLKIIIAGDGPDRRLIQELITKLSLQDIVTWIPSPDDRELRRLYWEADVVVLPNREIDGDCEGFGIVLLEAQACGKPVLCGNSGGTRETLLPDRSGFVRDCSDPRVLAEALIMLYEARNRLASVGQSGSQWVRRMFDWSVLIPKAQNLFRNYANLWDR